jgi:ADP-ribosyl-[dinitrogen reductase] hydrolase
VAPAIASLQDRAVGAYLGLAVGDALGATVEFMTPAEISAIHGVHNRIVGGGWLRLPAGAVTDDTEMALALGNSVLSEQQVVPVAVAEAFSTWMRGKPVDIGNTVRRGIQHYRSTGEGSVTPQEESAGNGACMRCLPVALATLGDTEKHIHQAVIDQAHVTHNNALSDEGTFFVVQLIQAALLGASKQVMSTSLAYFQSRSPMFRYNGKELQQPTGYIVDTLIAVFQAFLQTNSFEAALVNVVNRGGDADTTGAILGMICGAHYGVGAIPGHWLRDLNQEVRAICEQQATALLALAPAGGAGRNG